MGFDKLVNFLIKNLNNNFIDDINIKANIKKIIGNHIMFDINFIIYQVLIDLEEEINIIIKLILSLSLSINKYDYIEKKIIDYFSHISFKNNININMLFKGDTEDEIIDNFLNYINNNKYNNITIIENIIIEKIFNKINELINNIHYIDLIKTIHIIFDGIPSYSKILEQRRRRIKNYIESKEKKKIFDNYFKELKNVFQKIDNLNYDYFKWLKYRFTLDKSTGPSSLIIKYLEKYLNENLIKSFPNIIININSSSINGEADYKIFKDIYIQNLLGDIVIHTIDSDLVHQIIVQQNYFNIIKKDITLTVIRYNYKNDNNIQIIDANLINTNLLKVYNDTNNINYNNLNIVYDLALLFFFFGNDHLPTSYEINSELSLDYFCKCHYNSLKNNTIIKFNEKNNLIDFNLNNLSLYLSEININSSINKTKIILGKYFKITNLLTIFLTDKLKLNFNQIILLCKKLLFDDSLNNNILDPDDIRYKLKQKYTHLDFPFDINIKHISKLEITNNLTKLLNILDYSDTEDNYCGLPLYNKQFILCDDDFHNLYLNLIDNITSNLQYNNPIIYDYTSIECILSNNNIENVNTMFIDSYLKKIYHLVITLFGNMSNYISNNITFYQYYKVPSLYMITNYLNNNNVQCLLNNWNEQINNDNINDNYFNSLNHHLIITPFYKETIWKSNINEHIKLIIHNFRSLENFWYNNEDFMYKDFNIYDFNKIWFNTVTNYKINKIIFSPSILDESEKYLLEFTYD
jgi:hypothetical protein